MNAPETASTPPAHAPHGPHVLSPAVLVGTAAALVALTAVTVAAARVDLGAANVAVALGIATLKASLVALFFMHLKYEHRFHLVVLVGAAVFAALFASFVLFDASQYRPDVRAHEAAVREKGK
jgi:cytochrome c oxidase subunit 4